MTPQGTPDQTERFFRDFLLGERQYVVWNHACLYSALYVEMLKQKLHPIDVNAFFDKLVAEGMMVRICYESPLGATYAYLIGGTVTGVIDNRKG